MTVTYLLFAGTATVSATIRYALLLLLKHPHVHSKRLLHLPGPGDRREGSRGRTVQAEESG